MSLNDSQKKVIFCSRHCIVIACPGSGKTRVLAYKAEYISRVDPKSNIVVTTFTTDSASEIKSRIASVTGNNFKNHVASGTFHSLAYDQLKRAGIVKKIVQGSEAKQLVERAMEDSKITNLSVDDAIAYIDSYRTNMCCEHSSNDLEQLLASYNKLLEQINAIDFTGMLSEAVAKMRSGEILPKDCKYIFCDESQDMDPLQYAWVMEHIKAGATLTMVGDDDQSIYRFRGSLGLEGMLDFKKKLGAETIILEINYRSHSEILKAAGNVIINNTNRISKNLISDIGVGGKIETWHCNSSLKEANLVVERIKATIVDNKKIDPKNISIGLRKDEWAVLGRNHHNLNVLAMALKIEGIPHSTPENDIWEERPVCFAIALLTSIVDESRSGFESAMFYAGYNQKILSRCFEIYGEDITEFIYCACEEDLNELGEENSKSLNEFTRGIQKLLREYAKGNVNFVVRSVFDWFKHQMDLKVVKNENKSKKKKVMNEMKLMDIACRFLIKAEGTLKRRLQKVTNRFDGSESDQKISHEIFLGTLHSSKGLEFDNVWLLQIDDLVIPDIKQFTKQAIEEERRLFYVGMTRAKKFLYISCTKYPSKFIFETGVYLNSA